MKSRHCALIFSFLIFGILAMRKPGIASPREIGDIQKDINAVSSDLSRFTSPDQILDQAKRTDAAPIAIPLLKRMESLMEELSNADPQYKETVAMNRYQVMAMEAIFGDEEKEEMLNKAAVNPDAKTALSAKIALLSVDWIKTAKDSTAQAKVLDKAEALAKANSSDPNLTNLMGTFTMFGSASPELKDRTSKIIVDDLKPAPSQEYLQELADAKMLRGMENKPLVLSGASLDGKMFFASAWKGKVILVDFWATWCGPCRAELPRVEKAYADYHANGLEVLGISCDNSDYELKKFLSENRAMSWPQLFDVAHPGWNPLATRLGIHIIPTMFLIDKKGILRSVDAGENFEMQIPKLLAE